MYPYIAQNLAAERARDLREQAAAARAGTEARRARRGSEPVTVDHGHARRPGAPRLA